MKRFNVLLYFIVISMAVLVTSHGAPLSDEDDEYDDDPELPDRKAVQQKFQEAMEKLMEKEQQRQPSYSSTTTTTTTTQKPKVQKQKKNWAVVKDIRGYQVLTDGAKIHAELIKTRPMLRIRIEMPDMVRHVEKTYDRRFVELKIRNWDKVHKVHIKVPYGYEPEDLKIAEMKDYIDIIAPVYAEIGDSDISEEID